MPPFWNTNKDTLHTLRRAGARLELVLRRVRLRVHNVSETMDERTTRKLLSVLYRLTDRLERHRASRHQGLVRIPPAERQDGYSWHIR